MGKHLRRPPPFVASVYACGGYWKAVWYDHSGLRRFASVGPVKDRSEALALVDGQRKATAAAVLAAQSARESAPSAAFRSAVWFKAATGGSLNPDRLRAAWVAGRIAGRKHGSALEYNVESVATAYTDWMATIHAAVDKESGATPGESWRDGAKPEAPRLSPAKSRVR